MDATTQSAETGNTATSARLRRGPVACKRNPCGCTHIVTHCNHRCRRLRTKCNHEGVPPCSSCHDAGAAIAAECLFPKRGEKDKDREFRAKRQRTEEIGQSHQIVSDAIDRSAPATSQSSPMADRALVQTNAQDVLPPNEEVVEGFRVFITSYFQLGFIPKAIFLERLCKEPESMNTFLLLSILGISARFTPPLIKRYGSGAKATSYFLSQAARLVSEEMYEPSLERVQAFFLLSISEWGNGDKNRSFIHMGIAVRMAAILRLHREETYMMSDTATADDVVNAEMARRTFWMIQSQDNLHSGYSTPVSFSPADITALLPSDESDFAFGTTPLIRSALQNTPPAIADPGLVFAPTRSLFATLIQAHNLWGMVARRASRSDYNVAGLSTTPWESSSDYMQLSSALSEWERNLPGRQRWSVWNLRGYKAESQDLAYLSVVMVLRLSNIVLRRIYLEEMIGALCGDTDSSGNENRQFWQTMSHELFTNVHILHEQIDAYFPLRSKEDGYPAILVFCVYVCGSLSSYLWKWPQLCSTLSPKAEEMAMRSLNVLNDLQHAWPTAVRWSIGLKQVATPLSDPSLSPVASTKHAIHTHGSFLHDGTLRITSRSLNAAKTNSPTPTQYPAHDLQSPFEQRHLAAMSTLEASSVSPFSQAIGAFEADFTAFLQGDLSYGFPNGWDIQSSF